jgi:hypothetical protein
VNIIFIETKKTSVTKTVEKDVDGKKVKTQEVEVVTEEIPTVFESHPHEVLVSVVQRYTRRLGKRLPPGTVAWVVRLKSGALLGLLQTVKENGITEETKLVLEAA